MQQQSRQDMAIRNEGVISGSATGKQQRAIEYVTENGFSILRLSEIRTSVTDTARECHFLVRNPKGWEREICVAFADSVITAVQERRRSPLSPNSAFWVIGAERSLATYLWENDHYPDGGRLDIRELSLDELLLATHWSDQQGGY